MLYINLIITACTCFFLELPTIHPGLEKSSETNGMCCPEYSSEKLPQFSEAHVATIQHQYSDISETKSEIVSLLMYLHGFNLTQIML